MRPNLRLREPCCFTHNHTTTASRTHARTQNTAREERRMGSECWARARADAQSRTAHLFFFKAKGTGGMGDTNKRGENTARAHAARRTNAPPPASLRVAGKGGVKRRGGGDSPLFFISISIFHPLIHSNHAGPARVGPCSLRRQVHSCTAHTHSSRPPSPAPSPFPPPPRAPRARRAGPRRRQRTQRS